MQAAALAARHEMLIMSLSDISKSLPDQVCHELRI